MIRTLDDAENAVREVLGLPDRKAQLLRLTVLVGTCVGGEARAFLEEAQRRIREGPAGGTKRRAPAAPPAPAPLRQAQGEALGPAQGEAAAPGAPPPRGRDTVREPRPPEERLLPRKEVRPIREPEAPVREDSVVLRGDLPTWRADLPMGPPKEAPPAPSRPTEAAAPRPEPVEGPRVAPAGQDAGISPRARIAMHVGDLQLEPRAAEKPKAPAPPRPGLAGGARPAAAAPPRMPPPPSTPAPHPPTSREAAKPAVPPLKPFGARSQVAGPGGPRIGDTRAIARELAEAEGGLDAEEALKPFRSTAERTEVVTLLGEADILDKPAPSPPPARPPTERRPAPQQAAPSLAAGHAPGAGHAPALRDVLGEALRQAQGEAPPAPPAPPIEEPLVRRPLAPAAPAPPRPPERLFTAPLPVEEDEEGAEELDEARMVGEEVGAPTIAPELPAIESPPIRSPSPLRESPLPQRGTPPERGTPPRPEPAPRLAGAAPSDEPGSLAVVPDPDDVFDGIERAIRDGVLSIEPGDKGLSEQEATELFAAFAAKAGMTAAPAAKSGRAAPGGPKIENDTVVLDVPKVMAGAAPGPAPDTIRVYRLLRRIFADTHQELPGWLLARTILADPDGMTGAVVQALKLRKVGDLVGYKEALGNLFRRILGVRLQFGRTAEKVGRYLKGVVERAGGADGLGDRERFAHVLDAILVSDSRVKQVEGYFAQGPEGERAALEMLRALRPKGQAG